MKGIGKRVRGGDMIKSWRFYDDLATVKAKGL